MLVVTEKDKPATPEEWQGRVAMKLLDEFPLLVITLIVGRWLYGKLTKEHERHIKCKDDEIQRLVAERNRLQTLLYEGRKTTADTDVPPEPPRAPEKTSKGKRGRK